MLLHPVVSHLGGIVSVTLTGSFVGDDTDATDKQRISAYGDPLVNMAGTFVDPDDEAFLFVMGAPEVYRGITTQLLNSTARFMTKLPVSPAGQPATTLGPLDSIVADPVRAATVWSIVMTDRIDQAMTTLRAKTPAQLTSLTDSTI